MIFIMKKISRVKALVFLLLCFVISNYLFSTLFYRVRDKGQVNVKVKLAGLRLRKGSDESSSVSIFKQPKRSLPAKKGDNVLVWEKLVQNEKNNNSPTENQTNKESQNKNIESDTLIEKELCSEIPPGLGPSKMNWTSVRPILKMSMNVGIGGISKFYGCTPQYRAAIVIPVPFGTTKWLNLRTLLYHLHNFLTKQQLDYQVFVAEQNSITQGYNRGKLLNAAFTEIHRRFLDNKFPCLIIHDPNLMPLDSRNLYRCSWYPRQLATQVLKPDTTISEPIFGGAVAISHEQYINANGFTNAYWNNNSDLEDMYNRLLALNYTIEKTPNLYGKYAQWKVVDNPIGLFERSQNLSLQLQDGLTPLSYVVLRYEKRDIYTFISITYPETNTEETTTVGAVWSKQQDMIQYITLSSDEYTDTKSSKSEDFKA